MTNDREPDEVKEFRLEGTTLVVAVALLLAVLGGIFYLGRRVERSGPPPATGAARADDPLAHVASKSAPPADVDRSSGVFDRVEEERKPEPSRENAKRPSEPTPGSGSPPAGAPPEPAPARSDGDWFVQVWAGRDRQAAELLVDKLQGQGYPVRLFTDRVEGDTLYKVRVGGYGDDSEARRVSEELEGKGYRGAWVTSVR
jgi:cell division septation protein DedD